MTPSDGRSMRRLILVGLLLSGLVGAILAIYFGMGAGDASAQLEQIRKLQARGEFAAAEELAIRSWEQHPHEPVMGLLAAQCAESRGDLQRALEHAQTIPLEETDAAIEALRIRARLSLDFKHSFKDSEEAYLQLLNLRPDDLPAHEALAQLLGKTARRHEAVPHVLHLIRGELDSDLFMLLMREKMIIGDPPLLTSARKAHPDDARPLLGLAWIADDSERFDEAISLLHEAVQLEPLLSAAWGQLGATLATHRKFEQLRDWNQNCPASAENDPRVWLARGALAEEYGEQTAAIRCYWEVLKRSPESRMAATRFSQLLSRDHQDSGVSLVQDYLRQLLVLETAQDKAFQAGQSPELPAILDLIDGYEAVGRFWEALALSRFAVSLAPTNPQAKSRLIQVHAAVDGIPLELTARSFNPAWALDFSHYPLPRNLPSSPRGPDHVGTPDRQISFEDRASAANLHFRFEDGSRGPRLQMHEITGGGLGVVDYDVDGYPDLFCTQGGLRPPPHPSSLQDSVFRNLAGVKFGEVSLQVGIAETGFGQGVSVGDINSDGFPDLSVGNIGANALWVNQGDGTFLEESGDQGLAGAVWTTSCLVADLNRDGHPDLYDVNYLKGTDLFERVCQQSDGSPSQCLPFDFEPEIDQLWLNDGAGHFRNATAESFPTKPDGKGLGIAAWSLERGGPLVVLVANDTTPNFLWIPHGTGDQFRLVDQAIPNGIGLSGEGKPQGCMGIAIGDADSDGRMDVCLTNFLHESHAFYHAAEGGVFDDQTRQTGLREPTFESLGFGTQWLDADLDGNLELFVANGHIQDLRRLGRPYRMRPQLFTWHAGQFAMQTAESMGPYFTQEWLGRAVAKIDWNRDGREDLVVGHLDDPLALLTNTSPGSASPLSLKLIAHASARDAIGATVSIRAGDRTWNRQLTGGGGYQASNEIQIFWGCPGIDRIDELTLYWPSGKEQHYSDVQLPCRAVVSEQVEQLYRGPE